MAVQEVGIEKGIQKVTEQIIEKYQPEKIILFGACARGEFRPDGDVDFFIIKRDVPEQGAERIRQLSRLIERNFACDFLVYKPDEVEERLQLGDPFIKSVLNEGKVVYG